jgi:hypothetical protein
MCSPLADVLSIKKKKTQQSILQADTEEDMKQFRKDVWAGTSICISSIHA